MPRFVSIWFRYLQTDWFSRRHPALAEGPLVVRASSHGRMIITAANMHAVQQGIVPGMVLADARALLPRLEVVDEKPGLPERLLRRLAEWCIRFTPATSIDLPDGLLLDATGCAHLWSGEQQYLSAIREKLRQLGFEVRIAMADTIGAAWAAARFGEQAVTIIPEGLHVAALSSLPPAALRIDTDVVVRLHKLGLQHIGDVYHIRRASLRRRFGSAFLQRLDQALGSTEERIQPVMPPATWFERLPCLEPIITANGISIALERLLDALCRRLQQEEKGLRQARFLAYRTDGNVQQLEIGTSRPSHHAKHLYKLFENRLAAIEPALGIELFILEAPLVEDHSPTQEKIWEVKGGLQDQRLSELLDRVAGRIGADRVYRYLPAEHFWPERSYKIAASLTELPATEWRAAHQRPIHLLPAPRRIEVTAPVPDYPPMLFRYKGVLHKVIRADGPERIEQEWWLQQGAHRDYYCVEDEAGCRFWVFREGHYGSEECRWFLHGIFS
ncbi:MAG TPA: DNA polymerase Y family protein [Flavisolibacter sp.]